MHQALQVYESKKVIGQRSKLFIHDVILQKGSNFGNLVEKNFVTHHILFIAASLQISDDIVKESRITRVFFDRANEMCTHGYVYPCTHILAYTYKYTYILTRVHTLTRPG